MKQAIFAIGILLGLVGHAEAQCAGGSCAVQQPATMYMVSQPMSHVVLQPVRSTVVVIMPRFQGYQFYQAPSRPLVRRIFPRLRVGGCQ